MAHRTLFHRPGEINPDRINSEYLCCEHCQHWHDEGMAFARTKARGGSIYRVGQCLCEGDDRAPFADAGGPELPIFTQPHNRCGAFVLCAQTADDIMAVRATDRALDLQLARQAWA